MPGNIVDLTPQQIASWPAPNYDNPEERRWMPGYAGTLYSLATVCLIVRLLARRNRGAAGGFGIDDAVLVLGWAFLTGFTALAILGAEKYMTSRHIWDIPFEMFHKTAKITWIAELAFLLTGCSVKVSVLLFYRRLVSGTCSRSWIYAVIVAMVFTVMWTLAFIFALVFNCTPTAAYWSALDPNYKKPYHCTDTTVNNLLAGILAIVSDLYAVVLPCIMMRRLQISNGQRVGLYSIFSLGLVVVGASCARTYSLYQSGHASDISSNIFNVYVWSQLELSLGVMCASAPSMRLFLRIHLSEPISRLKRSLGTFTNTPTSSMQQPRVRRRANGAYSDIELSTSGMEKCYFGSKNTTHTTRTTVSEGTTMVRSEMSKQSHEEIDERTERAADVDVIAPVLLQSWHYTEAGDGQPQDNIIIDKHNRSWLQ